MEEAISPVSYRIGTPGKKGAILHRNHLKRFVQSHLQLTLPVDSPTDKEITFKLGQDLSKEQTDQLLELLEKYQKLFSETPGTTDKLTFDIQTGDYQPAKVRPYRIPTRWKDKLKTEIDQLLNLGIIRPSTSPWSAPVVCVVKPGGEIHMCVDYWRLNSLTLNDVYPMPRDSRHNLPCQIHHHTRLSQGILKCP